MGDHVWEILGLVVIGGGATEIIRWLTRRRVDAADVMGKLYVSVERELSRLGLEVDRLHILVLVLEEELVALGGDPARVRAEVGRRWTDAVRARKLEEVVK
jgi:hypothetical protein